MVFVATGRVLVLLYYFETTYSMEIPLFFNISHPYFLTDLLRKSYCLLFLGRISLATPSFPSVDSFLF